MDRQYPPFGQIPGPLTCQRTCHSPDTAGGAVADELPSASDRPACQSANLNPCPRPPRCHLLLRSDVGRRTDPARDLAPDITDEGGARVVANLASGSRGQDEGIDSRVYTLWFAVDLANADQALTVRVEWPEADIEHETVTLRNTDIQAGLALATLP
jgi:hypothetical protein